MSWWCDFRVKCNYVVKAGQSRSAEEFLTMLPWTWTLCPYVQRTCTSTPPGSPGSSTSRVHCAFAHWPVRIPRFVCHDAKPPASDAGRAYLFRSIKSSGWLFTYLREICDDNWKHRISHAWSIKSQYLKVRHFGHICDFFLSFFFFFWITFLT